MNMEVEGVGVDRTSALIITGSVSVSKFIV
jgi:hypothetical protein